MREEEDLLFIVCGSEGKLGLGRNTSLVAVYGQYQVIHHQHHQVILTMVARSAANTGDNTPVVLDPGPAQYYFYSRISLELVRITAAFHGGHQ